MYAHSLNVLKLSLKISSHIKCDKTVLSIAALLHDIGKTYRTDEQTLREKHRELNYKVSKDFIKTLRLSKEQSSKLKKILTYQSRSIEQKIIQDADIIAFFIDRQLQDAFKSWADKKGLSNEPKRKLDKTSKLNFDISKKIAAPYHQKLKKYWKL